MSLENCEYDRILTKLDIDIIKNGEQLEIIHLVAFNCLVEKITKKKFQYIFDWNDPNSIIPVRKDSDYIQLIYLPAHFVCCYYDTTDIYIYDSLNHGRLTDALTLYLQKLFPDHDLSTVIFPTVQKQPNFIDCGVYAIAFAVSLLFGMKPNEIRYNHDAMRNHLATMFETFTIEHFPQDPRFQVREVLPLGVALYRQNQAIEKRVRISLNKKYAKNQIERQRLTANPTKLCNESITIDSKKKRTAKVVEEIVQKPEKRPSQYQNTDFSEVRKRKLRGNCISKDNSKKLKIQKTKHSSICITNKFSVLADETENVNDTRTENKLIPERVSNNRKSSDNSEPVAGKIIDDNNSNVSNETTNISAVSRRYRRPVTWQGMPKLQLQKLTYDVETPILNNAWIGTDQMLCFTALVQNSTRFLPYEPACLQNLDRIKPVPNNLEHVQILHGDSHWICTYFSENTLHIYDSLNFHSLTSEQVNIIDKLYPQLDKNLILFHQVQQQPNYNDCGVFAIAFATSLVCGSDPASTTYDHPLMRNHLIKMLKNLIIEHFPVVDNLIHIEHEEVMKPVHDICNAILDNPLRKDSTSEYSDDSDSEMSDIFITKKGKQVEKEKQSKKMKTMKDKVPLKQKKTRKEILASRKNGIPTTKHVCKQSEIFISLIAEKLSRKYPEKDSRSEAEKIFKWCKVSRVSCYSNARRIYKSLQETAEANITKIKNVNANITDTIAALCGESKHRSTTEAYFATTSYNFKRFSMQNEQSKNKFLITNESGQISNILPVTYETKKISKKKSATWKCDESVCKIYKDVDLIKHFHEFLEHIMKISFKDVRLFSNDLKSCDLPHCQPLKQGHPESCYHDFKSCPSKFISTLILSPHFPKVRNIKTKVYTVLRNIEKIDRIDKALNEIDIEYLEFECEFTKNNIKTTTHSAVEIDLDEDNIIASHAKAFKAFHRKALDTPSYPCVSCEKLCFRRNVTDINNFRKPVDTRAWLNLMKYTRSLSLDCDYVCTYCLQKLRNDQVPTTCVLNNLSTCVQPEEISILNNYEKMLIQRAKAFQTVKRMGTVMNKNIPHKRLIPQVKGRTFHLPLPLEETLQKICPDEEPINLEQEFFILIRGLPKKSKIIWEDLVDMKKVFNALKWLKSHNPYYKNIILPSRETDVFESLNKTEFVFEDPFEDDEITKESEFNVNENAETKILANESIVTAELNNIGNKEKVARLNANHDEKIEETKETEIGETEDTVRKIDGQQTKVNKEIFLDVLNKGDTKKPMLTQISQSNDFYDQYTIYPINEKRTNETATKLFQMLKIHDDALNNRFKPLDLLCFPDLFPNGINGQNEDRPIKLSAFEFIKSKLMSKHAQFRLNTQYIFHGQNDNAIRQMRAGIHHKIYITNPFQQYTASTYLAALSEGELESDLNTIFSRLRNTEEYWKIPRNNLNCMIDHYGPATWFLTLTPAEWLWPDLTKYIRDINKPKMDKIPDAELFALDPVSVSRFIDNKFQAILDFIHSDDKPLGEIVHSFFRREYQGRGIQHFHLLLWVKDAPILGESPNEDVANFILKYATCRLPDKNISPTLYQRVDTHQRHEHNTYCLRSKKGKGRICRFGFPRSVTNKLFLRDAVTSIAGRKALKSKSRLYDLPRNEKEKDINDYNPALLTVWEGNMDIQFCGEVSRAISRYITKYETKPEKSNIDQNAFKTDIDTKKSIFSRLWSFGLKMLTTRECGALEAADTLLGIPLYGTDSRTTIQWININEIRNKKLKSFQDIKKFR